MKQLKNIIQEKLKLNKDIKVKNHILSVITELLNSNKDHNIDSETEKIFSDWIEDKNINKLKIVSYEHVFDKLYGNHTEIIEKFSDSDIEFKFLDRNYLFVLEYIIYENKDKEYSLFFNKNKNNIIYSVEYIGNISFQIKD